MWAPSRRRLSRAICVVVVLSVLGTGCASGGSLGAGELSRQLQSLQSLAAEGALLAQDSASGKTTRTYASEHGAQLYGAATRAEAVLKGAVTEPGLESQRHELVVLAGRVSAALGRLASASRTEDRVLARELHTLERVEGPG